MTSYLRARLPHGDTFKGSARVVYALLHRSEADLYSTEHSLASWWWEGLARLTCKISRDIKLHRSTGSVQESLDPPSLLVGGASSLDYSQTDCT